MEPVALPVRRCLKRLGMLGEYTMPKVLLRKVLFAMAALLILSGVTQAFALDVEFHCTAHTIEATSNWGDPESDGPWKGSCEQAAELAKKLKKTDVFRGKFSIFVSSRQCQEVAKHPYKIPESRIRRDNGSISATWTTRPRFVLDGTVRYPIWNHSFERKSDGRYIYKRTVIDEDNSRTSGSEIVRGVCSTD